MVPGDTVHARGVGETLDVADLRGQDGSLNTDGFADGIKTPGAAGALVRDLVLPVIMRRMSRENSPAWMHDHRISWDEPVSAAPV
ncbi:hypothetical protein GCM10017673_43900 [Streptosporangium violaceochromogenes]|nr:hypothetical protein GCM10017673_43900 [Streptosporangium violaceochromogenes]